MNTKYIKYLSPYIVPILAVLSLYLGGWYSFTAIIVLYGLLPLIELFTDGSTANMDAIEESMAAEDRVYDYLLYGLVPVQLFVLVYFLLRISNEGLMLHETIGMITAYGMAGGQSINNAHELGHRQTEYEQFMSKLLLSTTLYMHFFIEHNRGHHKHVATDVDPASSRYGENIYFFFIRSVVGSWFSAWRIENKRVRSSGHSVVSLSNEMIWYCGIQLCLVLIIWLVFGFQVLTFFVLGAIISFLLLESVNYIEHYGLQRKKENNRYERTLPIHSWNSNHPLGRLILLELSRHSDHHFMTNRKYQILRHFDESPQMPTGYPGMMLLAWFPPLWFYVMHIRIASYKASNSGAALA